MSQVGNLGSDGENRAVRMKNLSLQFTLAEIVHKKQAAILGRLCNWFTAMKERGVTLVNGFRSEQSRG